MILGPDGHRRYFGGNVRMPDVAVSGANCRKGSCRRTDLSHSPGVGVEVLSPGNTKGEIEKKLRRFFASGVKLAWVVDRRNRIDRVHTSADEFTE